ncbi:hypothetical protein C2S51_029528 [Perilla frutescens var. frutescens]|nr:hypothetical protein C2S51_029528 [Perilla frutescens var. frutescens]
MEESFAMNGGDGAYSYSKNSQYQKEASDSVMRMMEEAVISKLDLEKLLSISTTVTIADFGCSVGPNTFFTVQNLIKAFENKCSLQGVDFKKLEFQVLFNDQSANDFNTLFASLPPGRQYYAAGWLSKLQPHAHQFTNEGRIHYPGASGDVVRAYLDQFEKDVGVFLSARAEEIVRGGLLFLLMPVTDDGVSISEHCAGVLFKYLEDSLIDLAKDGVVERSAIDAFNLPVYVPTLGEITKIVRNAAAGCFTIKTMELSCPSFPVNAVNMITLLRSAMEGLFSKHFGTCVVDKMFANIFAKVEDNPHAFDVCSRNSTQLFLVLQRN